MPFVPIDPDRAIAQADRLSAQIGVARELALTGCGGPARKICGSVFLDHAMALTRDQAVLKAYVECLLLLEMTALLPRVIQAVHGVAVDVVPLSGSGPRSWRVTVGSHPALTLSSPGRRADRAEREEAAARSSSMILSAAAGASEVEMAPMPVGQRAAAFAHHQ